LDRHTCVLPGLSDLLTELLGGSVDLSACGVLGQEATLLLLGDGAVMAARVEQAFDSGRLENVPLGVELAHVDLLRVTGGRGFIAGSGIVLEMRAPDKVARLEVDYKRVQDLISSSDQTWLCGLANGGEDQSTLVVQRVGPTQLSPIVLVDAPHPLDQCHLMRATPQGVDGLLVSWHGGRGAVERFMAGETTTIESLKDISLGRPGLDAVSLGPGVTGLVFVAGFGAQLEVTTKSSRHHLAIGDPSEGVVAARLVAGNASVLVVTDMLIDDGGSGRLSVKVFSVPIEGD
jgi:hypothetical protein